MQFPRLSVAPSRREPGRPSVFLRRPETGRKPRYRYHCACARCRSRLEVGHHHFSSLSVAQWWLREPLVSAWRYWPQSAASERNSGSQNVVCAPREAAVSAALQSTIARAVPEDLMESTKGRKCLNSPRCCATQQLDRAAESTEPMAPFCHDAESTGTEESVAMPLASPSYARM